MSWYYSVNNRHLTYGGAFYIIIQGLVACGWTVKGSGDGTGGHYDATGGTAITSGEHVAYGFYNTGSWVRLQSPTTGSNGQKRELVFQQGGAGSSFSFRIKYSPNPTGVTGFTGGSPSATRVPSATDEVVIYGSGTDASPTYTGWGGAGGTEYNFLMHFVGDKDGAAGYSFAAWGSAAGTTAVPNWGDLALDVMVPGTSHPNDPDPAVIYINSGSGNSWGPDLTGGGTCFGFVGPYTRLSQFSSWQGMLLSSYSGWYGSVGTDMWTGVAAGNTCYVPYWKRTSNPQSDKGASSLMLANAQQHASGSILSLAPGDGGDRMAVGYVLLPWPSNTPPIII